MIGSTRNDEDRRLLQTLREEAMELALNTAAAAASNTDDDGVVFIVDQVG